MGFHTCAYFEAIDSTANGDVNALTDGILAIQNNHFVLPQDMGLMAACVMSATLLRCRLNSPTLRQIAAPQLRPITVGALPTDDTNVCDYGDMPLRLRGLEELAMEATSGVAMTENFTGILWLQDRFEVAPAGDVITLRATSTTAAVANSWTSVALTWETTPPVGLYAVIGGDYFATNGQAFRLTFDGMFYRPGGLGFSVAGRRTWRRQYKGGLGTWGRFRPTSLPRIEVLNNSTDAAHSFFLDTVKIAG